MIVTLTANPSIDRTVELAGPLLRGEVQRAARVGSEAGGKGVNVARAVTAAGQLAVAVLPSHHDDPLVLALRDLQVPHRAVQVDAPVRVNLTVAEPDGTTTKINDPGFALSAAVLTRLVEELRREAVGARWVVLSGSLPPGVPAGWYAEVVRALRGRGASVAVDTSGEPLTALLAAGPECAPDLLKPNAEELAEAVGATAAELEADPIATVAAAELLRARGVGAVLATLGAHGAVLVTADGSWLATPPRIAARSTVGAGDATLSGYLLGDLAREDPAQRLRRAVAYGAAATSLPGSAMPTPADLHLADVTVTSLQPHRPSAVATPAPVAPVP